MKMKNLLPILLLQFYVTLSAQTIELKYIYKRTKDPEFTGVSLEKKQEMIKVLRGVVHYFSVFSDGSQNVRILDSLTQLCNVDEDITTYPYRQILIKNNNNWDRYVKIDGSPDSVVYKIVEKQTVWSIDYSSTKNILGFKCFYAKNESDKEWAWVTLDIPITATPTFTVPLEGVVLEYGYESNGIIFLCTSVKINKEVKQLDCFDENNPKKKITVLNSYREFSGILSSVGVKMSTNMFQCRKSKK